MEMSERKSDLRDCLSPEVGSGDASSINLRDIMNSLEKPNYKTDFEQFQPGCPESIDLNSLTYDREEYDREFFGEDAEPVAADDEKDTSPMNRTPSYIAMMEHISKHRNRENTMPFAVSDILKGLYLHKLLVRLLLLKSINRIALLTVTSVTVIASPLSFLYCRKS